MGNKQAGATKNSTELSARQINLLKANTKFSEKEIRDLHTNFIRDNPNGRLDKKQYTELYKKFYPTGKVDDYCKYAFDAFDSNHDGTIDFEEFVLSIVASSNGSVDDRLSVAFDIYDSSNDGQIDSKELTNLFTAMYDLVGEKDRSGDRDPKKRAEYVMSKIDVSGDRKISKQEFIAGCKNDEVIRKILAPNV